LSDQAPPESGTFPPRNVRLGLLLFLGVVGLGRVVAVLTENVNWDELALLARADALVRTGMIQGGGRPGLVTAALAPIAAVCTDAVQGVVAARHFWSAMTLAMAGAFWALINAALPPGRTRWIAATTALAVWVLSPDFLRYSVQVRTDQPAILFALLGGLALLRSRQTASWALLAGVLFAVGFLATQKALYVIGLVGIVAGAWHLLRSDWNWRRELVRLGVCGASFVAVIPGYRALAQSAGQDRVSVVAVPAMQRVFEYYREFLGFRYYMDMLERNVPQLVALAILLVITLLWMRSRGPEWRHLAVGWFVVLAGAVVFVFHAARFPYFYLVLGLFPAAAAGFMVGPLLETTGTVRKASVAIVGLWAMLVATGPPFLAGMILVDDQDHQRASLRWIDEVFDPEARGFSSLSELVCQGDPDPFPNRFYQNVLFEFVEADGEPEVQRILDEFRGRPVAFMFEPRSHYPYPGHLWDFWRSRYIRYAHNVSIPGRDVRGAPGTITDFEVIVPGSYRWWPAEGQQGALVVGGDTLRSGDAVHLDRGFVQLELPEGGIGIFAWALAEPPTPSEVSFFRPF
jgi:hypothetical protein